VIVTGTSAQGAVAGTTNGAAQRGYKAVVPVNGMSSESASNELYAAWHIAKGGPANLVNNATLTRSDLIKFSNRSARRGRCVPVSATPLSQRGGACPNAVVGRRSPRCILCRAQR
jgi:hypothetical protein